MTRRQTVPRQWLIVTSPDLAPVGRLAHGSGVLVVGPMQSGDARRLRRIAERRKLTIVWEARRSASRVHNASELRTALTHRTPLILLSPIYPTRSHPDWKPLPRMRAAALARLANRRAIALGGMNPKRYAIVAPLGFRGWAGISAFRT